MSSEAQTERWLHYLSQQKNFSTERIQELQGLWQAQRQALQDAVAGISCHVDLQTLILHFNQYPSGEEIARVALTEQRPEPSATSGRRQWAALDQEGKYMRPISLEEGSQPELVMTPERSFITASSLHTHPYLLLSDFLLDVIQQDKRPHAVDLYLSPDRETLFVSHRQAGEVLAISLTDYEILERWQIRKPGSNRTLNVCFDSAGKMAYITDNESIQLWMIDLSDFKHKIWRSGLGVLGNLLPAPDPRYLYICTQRPQFGLLYFDTETLSTPYSVEIKGDSWCMQRILPCDPMQLSPDGKLLFFNTWLEEVGQRSPVINVVKTSSVRTIRRFAIHDGSQPSILAYTADNPLHALEKLSFEAFLLQEQILTESDFKEAEKEPEPELKVARQAPQKKGKFQVYQPPKDDPALWDQIGEPAEELDLPAEAEAAIVDLLNWAFYRVTLTNLLLHNEEVKRLKKLAHELRKQLRTQRVVLGELEDVMGNHSLRTPISREAVLEVMRQLRLSGKSIRFEDICPLCETPLEQDDGLACPACFYRLDLPAERDLRHLLSAETSTQLFPGQMLVVLPGQNRFYIMNVWRQLLTVFDGKEAQIGALSHATVLPNHNFLVADKTGNRVAEYSPSGELIWKAKLALRQPVMVTYHLKEQGPGQQEECLLIVDQGNQRVLELDRSGRHLRRYPGLRTPDAEKLKAPCDVQLTPADTWLISDPGRKEVLEISPRSELLRVFGAEQGVQEPLLARRLPDGRTWIVDAGLQACLELSPEGKRLRAVRYWPPDPVHGSHWKDLPAPTWVTRLHNGELVFAGENLMMQFSPEKEITRWIQAFPQATVSDQSLLRAQFRTRSNAEVRKKQQQEMLEELRKIHQFADASEEHLLALAGFVQRLKVKSEDWLIRPGELGNALYMLLEGQLEVVSAEEEGVVIFTLEVGEICGQQALLAEDSNVPKPGFRAKGEVRILSLERGEFKKAVVKFPQLFHLVRQVDADHQRRFKQFRERKSEALQEELRSRLAEQKIREFPLFAKAGNEFFDALSHLVRAHAYMPEQTVFSRNESGGSLFMLLEGRVSIQRKGDKTPVIELGAGEIFGEMSVLLDIPRSATVRTEDYCKMYELETRQVQELGAKYPWFHNQLLQIAQQRQQANAQELLNFETRVGIHRPDLPRVDTWALVDSRKDDLFYLPSLMQDVIAGFNWQGEILWFWGKESGEQLFQPYRLETLPESLLVTDTGNGRILEIDLETRKIRRQWRGPLQNPRSAVLTPQGFLLVADEGNHRLVTLTSDSQVNWEYGPPHQIMNPHYAELTPTGTVLYADVELHRVCEISLKGEELWSWGLLMFPGAGPEELNSPAFAHRLEDGSTLIADTGNHRLVWVRPGDETLILKGTAADPLVSPHHCQILENGDLLVSSASQERLVRLSRRGENIWTAHLQVGAQPLAQPTQASEEDRWILDLDRIGELETGPEQMLEIQLEQELISEPVAAEKPEEDQTALDAVASQRWQDLELEPEASGESEQRWKGLDFLDEEAPAEETLASADEIQLSELNSEDPAFAFLDEEDKLLSQTLMQLPGGEGPVPQDILKQLPGGEPVPQETLMQLPGSEGPVPQETLMQLPEQATEQDKPALDTSESGTSQWEDLSFLDEETPTDSEPQHAEVEAAEPLEVQQAHETVSEGNASDPDAQWEDLSFLDEELPMDSGSEPQNAEWEELELLEDEQVAATLSEGDTSETKSQWEDLGFLDEELPLLEE
ncbi:hypothetical protein COW36_21300 [bacterium (Candidatus Blackallbacteria) CG17_big_fil_post_rev_8_21_14_2_50_48_46]|uniref:Cyclic nucleotide-binding domain-containing protein n=1 Tax=bacterium (Candidatus Blackallbacteria) CG17_big_fil_post_rev_8_21_14_2_50_48_46 TaxID=2014261 RepID=A0A2M7FZ02_9BACT|nr:MAG: hypothetical protein COW64_14610 [bacterium (Candidatus Blackallbacteria) CG18_big_fil_WC_8_21_14_2_50_49_26]PIW14577.1 MAG: hypothetical protein COW36_21300 [bacterium (Candidatus Blackallbacteria) CG17_big_fil_post_rev_8_21_14_2_50_48_46]PIW47262.1 MAG: hypothetical protein COW20_13745 [bacterium (Candidatus Blackallbacteria) CG13_big_fil_rev_8_21_14_2_50_49_14]